MPLVSLLIPVYSSRFFEATLASALAQTFSDIEIIISDDTPNNDIENIVVRSAANRVKYIRNPQRLGFHGNFAHCFTLALGRYIKFLNHDDLLHPECVAKMVAAFEKFGEQITLVAARRHIINEAGASLPDSAATLPLSNKDSIVKGKSFGDHLLMCSVNLVGEPSVGMFRKSDVPLQSGTLFRIQRQEYTCLADLVLWLRLLARGDMAYFAQPLSYIRMHGAQLQQSDEVAARCVTERLYLPGDARTLGFLEDEQRYALALQNGANLVRQGLTASNLSPTARQLLEEAAREISLGPINESGRPLS